MQSAGRVLALVCCQHHYPTHTGCISRTLSTRLTAAVPLGLQSVDEAEAMIGISIMRNMTSEHGKSKVCDY